MVEIKWQNPPSRSRLGTQYEEIIDELKKNPGRWALITETWKTSGPPAAFKNADCQATCRANKDTKTWSLYARYPAGLAPAAAKAPDAGKAAVAKAVATGTALTPPPPAPKRAAAATAEVRPANDFGMSKFLADRHARGIPPERN